MAKDDDHRQVSSLLPNEPPQSSGIGKKASKGKSKSEPKLKKVVVYICFKREWTVKLEKLWEEQAAAEENAEQERRFQSYVMKRKREEGVEIEVPFCHRNFHRAFH